MRVQYKLFSITLLASLVLIVLMLLLAQWGFDRGLLKQVNQRQLSKYENMLPSLQNIYQRSGSWRVLALQPQLWHTIKQQAGIVSPPNINHTHQSPTHDAPWGVRRYSTERPPQPKPQANTPYHPEQLNPSLTAQPLALLDNNKNLIIGHEGRPEDRLYLGILVDGNAVGYLSYTKRDHIFDDYDLELANELSANLWWIAALMVLISATLALPFARMLLKPVQPIVNALHELANGNLQARTQLNSKDEIAAVANDVNALAQALQDSNEKRKTWLANISHELRTPIAVMRGELEAMIDGVRPIDKNNIISAHEETLHLQRLIEDLYELTSSDIGAMSFHKNDVDGLEILNTSLNHFQDTITQAGLEFEFINSLNHASDGFIYADAQRITQLLHNLVQNSIKYTQSPGKLIVHIFQKNKCLCISIEDSAPGVNDEELDKIFEYLYRSDRSRNRQTGGAGLGLAICQNIAKGHNGQLTACHSLLGGLKITLHLPQVIRDKK